MAAKPPVLWAPEARADLSTIWDYYLSLAGTATADDIVRRIGHVITVLQEHPHAGRSRDEIRPGLRSLAVTPYVVFYRVRGDVAELVRILDGRRDLDEIFPRS
jgi:toxin ParE1/3/4